ncbi:MAG TPA: hypothetical protein VGJ15_10155 [Pirellulales bacterium]
MRRHCRLLALALISAVFALAIAAGAFGDAARANEACPTLNDTAACHIVNSTCVPRTSDAVWLVSSRCLGCPDMQSLPPRLEVWKYDLDRKQWNQSSLEIFLAAQNPEKTTIVWVHGNQTDMDKSRWQGLGVYHQLTNCVSGERAINFVIFSWPATRSGGLREDAREKAARTNSDGFYLAWLVNQIDHGVKVNFVGFSFGARIVTGALHLLGGGMLCGRALPQPIEPRAPMQAVLLAAAVNNNWLAVGRPHGQALFAVDRMLALNNGCDRALKHYRALDPCTKPEALGYTGAVGPLGPNRDKLRQTNLCCVIGKEHNWENYFYTPSVVARMRSYLGLVD